MSYYISDYADNCFADKVLYSSPSICYYGIAIVSSRNRSFF